MDQNRDARGDEDALRALHEPNDTRHSDRHQLHNAAFDQIRDDFLNLDDLNDLHGRHGLHALHDLSLIHI